MNIFLFGRSISKIFFALLNGFTYLTLLVSKRIFHSKPKPYMPDLYGVVKTHFNCDANRFYSVNSSQSEWGSWYTNIVYV